MDKQTTSKPEAYEKPQIRVLGSVVELTQGSTGLNGDGILEGKKAKNKGSSG